MRFRWSHGSDTNSSNPSGLCGLGGILEQKLLLRNPATESCRSAPLASKHLGTLVQRLTTCAPGLALHLNCKFILQFIPIRARRYCSHAKPVASIVYFFVRSAIMRIATRKNKDCFKAVSTSIILCSVMTKPQADQNPKTYTFEFGNKKLTLDFPRAFAIGDALFEAGQLAAAKSVFEVLSKVSERGPRAKIMLAQCEAALQHFAACSEILDTTFTGEDKPIAEELQTTFVSTSLVFATMPSAL